MKIKTSELSEKALDWAVAKALGWQPEWDDISDSFFLPGADQITHLYEFSPTTDREQGGQITENEKISTIFMPGLGLSFWKARKGIESTTSESVEAFGKTPLIAAMRCYVTSKFGNEIEVPDVLYQQPDNRNQTSLQQQENQRSWSNQDDFER